MEAKDTVMSEEQIVFELNCSKGVVDTYNSNILQVAKDVAKAQAEISFKAGLKEVGEWLDNQKIFISYHYFKVELHDNELEGFKQGKMPNSMK